MKLIWLNGTCSTANLQLQRGLPVERIYNGGKSYWSRHFSPNHLFPAPIFPQGFGLWVTVVLANCFFLALFLNSPSSIICYAYFWGIINPWHGSAHGLTYQLLRSTSSAPSLSTCNPSTPFCCVQRHFGEKGQSYPFLYSVERVKLFELSAFFCLTF